MASEPMPDAVRAMRLILVRILKLTCLLSKVVCIRLSELKGSARKITLARSVSKGWLKNPAMSGEQTNNSR